MGGGGGRINKPRTAACKSVLKGKKAKIQARKKLKSKSRSTETLNNTTEDILKQCRTNPKANVKLSGKKKRILLKEAKRLLVEKSTMELTKSDEPQIKVTADSKKMDTT